MKISFLFHSVFICSESLEQEISRGAKRPLVKGDLIDIPVQDVNRCLMVDDGDDGDIEKEEENRFWSSYVRLSAWCLLTFSYLLNKETKLQKGKQLPQDQSLKPKNKPEFVTPSVVYSPFDNAGCMKTVLHILISKGFTLNL